MKRGRNLLFLVILAGFIIGCTPIPRSTSPNLPNQQSIREGVFEEMSECPRGLQTVKTFGLDDYILRPSADGSFLVFRNKDNREIGLTSYDNQYNQKIEIDGREYHFRAKVDRCNIIFITETDAFSLNNDNSQNGMYPVSISGRVMQDTTSLTININIRSKEIIVVLPLAGKSMITSQSSNFENAESIYIGRGKWKISSNNPTNEINGKIILSFVPDLEFYPGEVPIAYLFTITKPVDGKIAIKSYISSGIGWSE